LLGGWGTSAASDNRRCSPDATLKRERGCRKWVKTGTLKKARV